MKKHYLLLLAGIAVNLPGTASASICEDSHANPTSTEQRVLLPEAVIAEAGKSGADTSIQALSAAAQQGLDELRNNLDNNSPFRGVYVIGSAAQRIPDNAHQGYLGLEWQIFRRGYFNGKHKAELGKTEALIDAYTLRRHLHAQSLDQALYQAKRMQNTLRAYLYKQMLTQQTQLTALYRKRVKAGYATRRVLVQEESALQDMRDKAALYAQLPQAAIPMSLANLLNHLDSLRLMPLSDLEKQALSQSGINELQTLFTRQAALTTPNWSDNLTLGIYARRRSDYNTGTTGNELGVQVDIPLGGNTSHDKVVQLRARLQRLQLQADKIHLREQLASLSDQFQHTQDQIRQLQHAYALSLSLARLDCTQARHVVPTLTDTPEKTLEQLPVTLLEQQENIFAARFDAYRLLLQLQAKVQPGQGAPWYSIR